MTTEKPVSTIKQRVMRFIESQHMKKADFFATIGMTYAAFKGDMMYRGLNSTAIGTMITKYPQVNPDWLLTGRGDMLRDTAEGIRSQQAGMLNPDLLLTLMKLFFGEDKAHAKGYEQIVSMLTSYLSKGNKSSYASAPQDIQTDLKDIYKQLANLQQEIGEMRRQLLGMNNTTLPKNPHKKHRSSE